ncbi:hypothetical protein CR513_27841, partial [Mucuna pruriens]
MKRMFLEKFFPASRTMTIRKEICGIKQHSRETLHEYWEGFNKLCTTYPHHQISEKLLIQYIYTGLMMMDRSMIDSISGRVLMDKTPTTTRHLISNMASNTQQFKTRGVVKSRVVNEVGVIDNLRLENQLAKLTSLVRQLVVEQHQPSASVRVYGICTSVELPTNASPIVQENKSDNAEIVGSIGGYQYGSSTERVRVKGNIRPRDSDPHKVCLNTRVGISSQFQNTKYHRFDNNNNNNNKNSRFRSRTIHFRWKSG